MSLNIAMLEEMQASGLDLEAVIRILRAGDIRRDPTAAERQARHREKVKAERDVTRDVTRDITLSPLVPPKVSPGPPSNNPPISPKPTNDFRRATRLAEGWRPEMVTGKAADMVRRWQAGEMEREIAKFRNYWMGKAGKDSCKLDWQRTWINWLISADERKPCNGGHHSNIGKSQAAFHALNPSADEPF